MLTFTGARIDARAGLIDRTPLSLVAGPGEQDQIRLAAHGRDYLVAWNDNRRHCPSQTDPCFTSPDERYAAQVSAQTGTVVGAPWRVGAIAYNADPIGASDALGYLLVWPQRPDPALPLYRWVASRVAEGRKPTAPILIEAAGMERTPVLFVPGPQGWFWMTSTITEVDGRPYLPGGRGGQVTRLAYFMTWLDSTLAAPGREQRLFEETPSPCVSVVSDRRGPWLIYDSRQERAIVARRLSPQGWDGPAVHVAQPRVGQ